MGYTHSWRCQPGSGWYAAIWPQLFADTRSILDTVTAAGTRLTGPDGTGTPWLDPATGVAFNGVVGQACDTFRLDSPGPDRPQWRFCKTDAEPYDLAVTAVLLRAHLLLPSSFHIGSEGSWDADWEPARDLVWRVFRLAILADPLVDTTEGMF
ncbi:hypothetical protein [Dactylosporangium sp. CA-233914]|uniref:hypothetical protein n=1 Tax=Dactylosporangium sp. CA-233914 TaxID=3239934 RepID=UPI003D8DBC4C